MIRVIVEKPADPGKIPVEIKMTLAEAWEIERQLQDLHSMEGKLKELFMALPTMGERWQGETK